MTPEAEIEKVLLEGIEHDGSYIPVGAVRERIPAIQHQIDRAILTELELLPAWNNCRCQCASCKVIGGRIKSLTKQQSKEEI